MDDALTLLRLQVEWGADESLELEPFNRLRPAGSAASIPAPTAAKTAPATADAPTTGVPTGELSRLTQAERAAALANQATTLDALRETLAAFDGCPLRDTASNLVFAQGDPGSTTLIIGEPPGREEDRGGNPFAGAEGVLLDQILASIGLDRTRLMLTPLLPWRPPGGRPPNAGEVAMCLPFLHRLIVLLHPRRLVIFGGSQARALLPAAVTRRRQTPGWLGCRLPGMGGTLPTLSLPSLAEMQKTPSLRREAWAGLRLLRRAVEAE